MVASSQRGLPAASEWTALGLGGGQRVRGMGDRGLTGAGRIACVCGGGKWREREPGRHVIL